jgi:hypothetical protein
VQVAFLLTTTVAIARFQVDNRVNPQLAPVGGAQNDRPNDYSVGTSIYYRTPRQFMLLPSEHEVGRPDMRDKSESMCRAEAPV